MLLFQHVCVYIGPHVLIFSVSTGLLYRCKTATEIVHLPGKIRFTPVLNQLLFHNAVSPGHTNVDKEYDAYLNSRKNSQKE